MSAASHADSELLILEIRVRGLSHKFELAGEERAVTVGSAASADLRLNEPGVAPVHFHFEREGDEVWLIPTASAGRLRLNAARVHGKCRVRRRSVLNCGGIAVDVRVVQNSKGDSTWLATHASELVMDGGDYIRSLPAEDDTTLIGFHAGSHDATAEAVFPTAQMQAIPQIVTAPMPVVAPPRCQFNTQPMPVVQAPPEPEPSQVTSSLVDPEQWAATRSLTETLALPVSKPPAEAAEAVVVPSVPAKRRSVCVPPERQALMGRRSDHEVRSGDTANGESRVRSLLALVTRLGRDTQERPLRVLALAFAVALSTGALAAGISRLEVLGRVM